MGSSAHGLVVVGMGLLLLHTGCAYEHAYPRTDSGAFEIKELPPARVLLTRSDEPYFDRSNELFGRLFSYIDERDIPMTVPVEMRSEPGTMIFFVGSEAGDRELDSAGAVTVEEFPARLVASHGARGSYTAENFQEAAARLREWLDQQTELKPAGKPYAVYWHGPFVPGFLKRYEVHIPVEKRQNIWMGTDIWVRRPEANDEKLDLDGFQWKNRLLLVFASDEGQDELEDFGSALKQEEPGVLDRDRLSVGRAEWGLSGVGDFPR